MSTKEDEFESVTADLHARLEKTEEALTIARREEKEASLTVTQHSEQIASLEAELGAVQRRSKLLEEVNHKTRDKIETQIGESAWCPGKATRQLTCAVLQRNTTCCVNRWTSFGGM